MISASWSGAGWSVRSLQRRGDAIMFDARLSDPDTTAPLRIILSDSGTRLGVLEMPAAVLGDASSDWRACSLPLDALEPV